VDELRKEIGKGKYKNWDEIHRVYDFWDKEYSFDKCRHAWAVLAFIKEANKTLDVLVFKRELAAVLKVRQWMDEQIRESRIKDYRNPFKKTTFRNQAEMEQVLGKPNDNPFLRIVHKESVLFAEMIERVSGRLTA
jgi:hypothetical protein